MLANDDQFINGCYVCHLKYLRDKAILDRYCDLMESEMGVSPEDALRNYMARYHDWHLEMEDA